MVITTTRILQAEDIPSLLTREVTPEHFQILHAVTVLRQDRILLHPVHQAQVTLLPPVPLHPLPIQVATQAAAEADGDNKI
jgi:hypothetical protein